jgi:hypothetical protein
MNMRTAQMKASTLRDLGLSQKLYLLMVPNTAVVGDVIWALAGGQTLYILRPMNREINQYGEMVRRLHLGEARMEDISLI